MIQTLAGANGVDKRTGRLTVNFSSTGGYANRFVAQCVLSSGLAPSYAFATIPTVGWGPGAYDRKGLAVAMKATGPTANTKLLSRASVQYEVNGIAVTLMTGWLVSQAHQLSVREDSAIGQIFDDKIILDKFTVSGCLCWDPIRNVVYWDDKRKCIFNELGWPNCLDHPTLGPIMAPCHRFGYQDGFQAAAQGNNTLALDSTEPGKGQATVRARSFDCADALSYLRLCHAAETRPSTPNHTVDVGSTHIPSYINWPAALGTVFGNTLRILKHEQMQGPDGKGLGLGQAIQQVIRKNGCYDIYFAPAGNGFGSQLCILDLNPGQNIQTTLLWPDYNPAIRAAMNANVISEGHIVESAVDYFHDVCMEGDGPSVELMIAMPENALLFGNPSSVEDSVPTGLQAAWSALDEMILKQFVVANQGNAGDGYAEAPEAIQQAFTLYPWVYAAYRVTDGFNPWNGTKWAGCNNGGRIRFKPFLNTGYQMDSSSPANWQPREIVIERYRDESIEFVTVPPQDDPFIGWERTQSNGVDALTLSADSTVMIFSGARRAGDTYYIKIQTDADDNPVGTPGDNLHLRPIRANVALEADWPITGRTGLGQDPNGTLNRVSVDFKYTWRVPCPPGDYQELLRRGDAYPIGKAKVPASVTTAFPARCTQGNELWTDRTDPTTGILPDHATTRLRDVKRIAYYANVRIPGLSVGMKPGMSVGIVGPNNIPCNIILKSVKFSMVGTSSDPKENPAVPDTWIEGGPPDMAVLMNEGGAGHAVVSSGSGSYDIPATQTSGGGSGSGSGSGGGVVDDTSPVSAPNLGPTSPFAGGGSMDEYEKAIAPSLAASGQTGATAGQTRGDFGAVEGGMRGGMIGALNNPVSRPAANAREQHAQERKARKTDTRASHAKQLAIDKAFQRSDKGGGIGDIRGGFGKGSAGSMRFGGKTTKAGDLFKDRGFGQASSGRMGSVSDLNKVGRFDTRKGDAFSSAQSRQRDGTSHPMYPELGSSKPPSIGEHESVHEMGNGDAPAAGGDKMSFADFQKLHPVGDERSPLSKRQKDIAAFREMEAQRQDE